MLLQRKSSQGWLKLIRSESSGYSDQRTHMSSISAQGEDSHSSLHFVLSPRGNLNIGIGILAARPCSLPFKFPFLNPRTNQSIKLSHVNHEYSSTPQTNPTTVINKWLCHSRRGDLPCSVGMVACRAASPWRPRSVFKC